MTPWADVAPSDWEDWRWQLRHSIRSWARLASALGFSRGKTAQLAPVADRYPVRVTPYYLSLARGTSTDDPIIRQCVPSAAELEDPLYATDDPLAERRCRPGNGLVHRYPDRALIRLSNRCAVYCRHCFRKCAWCTPERVMGERELERALEYVARNPEIREILLSGGEPLLIGRSRLDRVLARIFRLRHVEVVRIGSRLPVVLPQYVDSDLCTLLGRHGTVWLATHFNHPREVTEEAAGACNRLVRAGVPLVNQAVLLKGVNDDAETIRALGTALLRVRVRPYYLLHADPARGATHFRTGVAAGLRIMSALRGRTSGIAVPTFALDLPQGGGKAVLEPDARAGRGEDGGAEFLSFDGRCIPYL